MIEVFKFHRWVPHDTERYGTECKWFVAFKLGPNVFDAVVRVYKNATTIMVGEVSRDSGNRVGRVGEIGYNVPAGDVNEEWITDSLVGDFAPVIIAAVDGR
jgi:hypothetical protein